MRSPGVLPATQADAEAADAVRDAARDAAASRRAVAQAAANFLSIVVLPLLAWFGTLVITILGAFGDYFLYRVCFAIDVARDKFLPLEYVLTPFCALFSLGHGFLTIMGVPLSEGDLLVLLLYLSLAVCFRGYLWSAVVCWAKNILGLLVNYSGLILRLCMLSAEFGVYVPPVARACLVATRRVPPSSSSPPPPSSIPSHNNRTLNRPFFARSRPPLQARQ